MKIAIYGAGAMGTVLGAFLAKSGADVDLISRNREHVAALKRDGAKIVCVADGTTFIVPVFAKTEEEIEEKYDIVFLMTKQRENDKNARKIQSFLSEKGVVCTTQNGLPEEGLSEILGKDRVLGCVCTFGARMSGAGVCELTSELSSVRTEIGTFGKNEEAVDSLKTVLLRVGETFDNFDFVRTTDNLAGVRWNKLTINAAFSTLSVVTGETFGEIAKGKRSSRLALAIIRECLAVRRALGIRSEKMQGHDLERIFGKNMPFARRLLPFAVKKHGLLRSGMLADIEKGRKCEVDFVAGAVTKRARKAGVKTPVLDKAIEIVHGIENGQYEIAPENTVFF